MREKRIYKCGTCGSKNVQYVAWVKANTNEVLEDFGSWNSADLTYCENCEDTCKIVTEIVDV